MGRIVGSGHDLADPAGLASPSALPRNFQANRPLSFLVWSGYCSYSNWMAITYDPVKRSTTLADRGLDFDDAEFVFEGVTLEIADTRRNYGETRIICYGLLRDRFVVIGYVPRGEDRHIFSMRKANGREAKRIAPFLAV